MFVVCPDGDVSAFAGLAPAFGESARRERRGGLEQSGSVQDQARGGSAVKRLPRQDRGQRLSVPTTEQVVAACPVEGVCCPGDPQRGTAGRQAARRRLGKRGTPS